MENKNQSSLAFYLKTAAIALLVGGIGFGSIKLGEVRDRKSAETQKSHITFPIKYDACKEKYTWRGISKDIEQKVDFSLSSNVHIKSDSVYDGACMVHLKDSDTLNSLYYQLEKRIDGNFSEVASGYNLHPDVTNNIFLVFDSGNYRISFISSDKKGHKNTFRRYFTVSPIDKK